MNFTPAFSLDNNQLKFLGPDRAVDFFRRLLWAEASRVGIGRNLIQVPGCINVGDGGIDAYIENADPLYDEIIPKGTTGFQIKSSDLSPAKCKEELHVQKSLDDPLKPEIKRILDEGGNYVLVLFADLTTYKKRGRQHAVQTELSKFGYENQIRVYAIDQLIGFTERFISLVTWLKSEFSQCLSYSSWAERSDIKKPKTFIPDEKRNQWIKKVRDILRGSEDVCPVFRIIGLSGIGKTRLVFEALSDDDLKNRVIYFQSADQFRSSTLLNTIQTNGSISAILVIDECDIQNHDYFVRSFSSRGKRIALFTISHDFAQVPSPAKLIKLPPLGNDEIVKLIQSVSDGLPMSVVRKLTEFADGYPRIATLLAESYIKNGGSTEEFIKISDEGLMDRLIGGKELSYELAGLYKRVLTGISLFQKIGYEGSLQEEAQWLSDFLQVDWRTFGEAVNYERRRGIIQGDYYLIVSPFMLRIYLLNDWWEVFGFTKDNFDEFIDSIPDKLRPDLIKRFFEHIPYISSTEGGRRFTHSMLKEGNMFEDGELLRSELGSNFFMKLSEADPESALKCLKRTIGRWSKTQLMQFTIGRREVIYSLEKIAIWRELFPDAARLLLALGEAENESWSNNASGIFVELFSHGTGELAPTEATPDERIVILEEALNSTSKEKIKLALRACDQALKTHHFSRMIGSERQGLRRTPNLWLPKTYKELYDSYRRVWHLLSEKIDSLPEDEQEKAINIILQNSRGLGINPHLVGMVIGTLKTLIAKKIIEVSQVITVVHHILHFDSKRMHLDVIKQWESFRDELNKNDFSSLLIRYVKIDLITDKIDKEGNSVDILTPQIKHLARLTVGDRNLLGPELQWLVTTEARNGYQFGFELAEIDEDQYFLPAILLAQSIATKDSSLLFLSGYFSSLHKRNEDYWKDQIQKLTSSTQTASWIPELIWRSGLNNESAKLILHLAKTNLIKTNQLSIFEYGGAIKKLNEENFQDWIHFLLNSSEKIAASIALGLHHSYYLGNKPKFPLPENLTVDLLMNPVLIEANDKYHTNTMDDYHWTELSKSFIHSYPEKALKLCDFILENIGTKGTILDGFNLNSKIILGQITQISPKEVWWKITKYLGPPIDSRAFHLKDWLNGDSGFGLQRPGSLSIFPMEEVFKWVEEDIENRAWYLASFVPQDLFRDEERLCYARELLIRYGHREDVKNNLMANLSTEGWSGPASLHFQEKKNNLLEFLQNENEEVIINCVNKYITSIDKSIEQAKIREERGRY
ncbi:MAG: hypothetical protein ACTSQ8_22375 [Candidatus Helarchaeota archaeon]